MAATVGRNDPCPCGSGKKYKTCCLRRLGRAGPRRVPPQARAATQDVEVLRRELARALRERDWVRTLSSSERLLASLPDDRDGRLARAEALVANGNVKAALSDVEYVLDRDPRDREAMLMRIDLMAMDSRYEDALDVVADRLRDDDRQPDFVYWRAYLLDRLNRLDEARAAVESALALAPDHVPSSILNAQILRRQKKAGEAVDLLEPLALQATDRQAELLWQELGLGYDQLGRFDDAVAAFEKRAELQGRTLDAAPIDSDLPDRLMKHYRVGLSKQLVGRFRQAEFDIESPFPLAFLVGFPRSGTTLLEQILASHPNVVTTNEQPFLLMIRPELAGNLIGTGDVPTMLERLEPNRWHELRMRYWRYAADAVGVSGTSRTIVDKAPLNLVDVGLISCLFPEARIVVALRDPRDVCVSCFIQRFGFNPFMKNLTTFADIARTYASLMSFWIEIRERLAPSWIEVRYETVVEGLEAMSRRLLDFLELPWDAAVLNYHQAAKSRQISSPSYEAVVQPIYRRAVGRWKNYRGHLEPVLPVLAPLVEAFGYEPS